MERRRKRNRKETDVTLEKQIAAASARARGEVERLGLFDSNLWLGQPDYFPLAREIPAGELAAVLKEYGIRGGLVSHWDGIRLSAQEGNEALRDAEARLPDGVWTVWTGLPLAPGEQTPLPGTGTVPGRMRGVRLFPTFHRYQLSPWVVGSLCEWCIAHAVPLFFWHVEVEWEQVYRLATIFPALTIVVDTQWQKILYHNRDLASLLDACGNVLVESSNLIGQDFIRWIVKKWGAHRILYGSFLPASDPYAPIGMILDAEITDAEKALIAGGNARRLVEGVRT
jgi:uncharacterized protein